MIVVDTDVIANFCSSYCCEIALFSFLDANVVTGDTDLARRFPDDAVLKEDLETISKEGCHPEQSEAESRALAGTALLDLEGEIPPLASLGRNDKNEF